MFYTLFLWSVPSADCKYSSIPSILIRHAAALTIRVFLGELANNCRPDSGNRWRDYSNHDRNRHLGRRSLVNADAQNVMNVFSFVIERRLILNRNIRLNLPGSGAVTK